MNEDGETEKDIVIRVLRVITRMNIGGPAIQVTTLMNYLPRQRVNQILVTGDCDDGEADYLEFNNISLERTRIPSLSQRINPFKDVIAVFSLRRAIKAFEPNIVHTHTFKAGLLGRLAALSVKNKTKLVHTFHGHLLTGYFGFFKVWIIKILEKFLADRTDVLVSVGEKVKNDLIEAGIGNQEKFVVIPPGFPVQAVQINSKISSSTDDEVLKCAWVGRLVEIKAPSRVLEIARFFSASDSGVEFCVIGDGPLRLQIEKQSEAELLPIRFSGWRSNVLALLKEFDLVILTSLNEGMPLSIIEAQRMGVPVISTDVGSVREIVSDEKSGYVIDYEPSRFAELIKSFATNRDKLKDFSIEAHRFSGSKFAPERLAQDYLRIYESLASN